MTILVSRTWPMAKGASQSSSLHGHPHFEGRGSGNAYTYPDEMWAAAQKEHRYLLDVSPQAVPGCLVRYEWVRGYPDGYALLEGAVCSLDDKPEEFLPGLNVDSKNPRVCITIDHGAEVRNENQN